MEKQKILCIDDCKLTRDVLKKLLEKEGYDVACAENEKEAFKNLKLCKPDIILLDLLLRETDGLSLLKSIRTIHENMPIIMISGRGEEIDRIIGIEAGADDYLGKPFNPRELIVRIQSVLKRAGATTAQSTATNKTEKIKFNQWILTPKQFQVLNSEGDSAELTTNEYLILEKLITNPHQALSREQLFAVLRNHDMDVFDRAVDIQITRIRAKLQDTAKNPKYIKTVRGIGYMFICETHTL